MGCMNTKEDENLRDTHMSSSLVPLPSKQIKSPLSEKEIESRIECPNESQIMQIGKITYRYAYVSQRGYYPDAPSKDNQDCYTAIPKIDNLPDSCFFGVYDGHGKEGHHCARYVRDRLPHAITNAVASLLKPTPDSIKRTLHNTHLKVNRTLHESRVDDSLSGTTSISILFIGRTMYISNVGDSRAIIISAEDGGKLKARPLSSDQTPYRKDERDRVKKYGARVMSMDQIEGIEPIHENWGDINLGEEIDEGGDPPRIWSPHGAYPGTAFTRSFGDMYAEELGVTAEPEILIRDIQPNDRFIVLASDGVFEFLTNQMVADMISQRSDPLDACRAIVAQSYELWLQYEVRTDDITIIAIYIQSGSDTIEKTIEVSLNDIHMMEQITNRPVRRAVSREKRKILIQAIEQANNNLSRIESDRRLLSAKTPKTKEEISEIQLAINDNFLFHHLSESQRVSLIEMMQKVNVKQGDWIIKQGDVGDKFYIIQSGKYEVRVKTSQTDPNDTTGGTIVHVYESGPNQHPCFGELALMYGKPRAASVIAQTDGTLWALDRFIFVNSVLRTQTVRKDILRILRKGELLKSLNTVQLQRLVDLMSEAHFSTDELIIKQGEQGETFYVIISGTCSVIIKSPNGEEKVVAQLGPNDFFGERALLNSEPRAATIKAITDVEVLQIGKSGFEEVLGQLSVIIAANEQHKTRIVSTRNQNIIQIPTELKDLQLLGFISTDKFGSISLCSYNSTTPNYTLKTLLLDSKSPKILKQELLNVKEAATIIEGLSTPHSLNYIPSFTTSFRTSNGFHMLYDVPIIGSLESFYESNNSHLPYLPFIIANIINGLEFLHSIGIIYRAIQPEAIHLTLNGKVVLIDYIISKIGGVGGRTFTLCGVPDYLSPEQVSQQGHNEAVDFWSLGVLIYELVTHQNPFSKDNNGELAIFSKITSYGTSGFPSLSYSSIFSENLISLITLLLNPQPELRLGYGKNGFEKLKSHNYFTSPLPTSSTSSTDNNNNNNNNNSPNYFNPSILNNSPILNIVKEIKDQVILEGVMNDIVSSWEKPVNGLEDIEEIFQER